MGIQSSPDQIIKLWEEYETKGFPLEEIAQSLYVVELMGFIKSWKTPSVTKSWKTPSVTLLAEVIVLLESINKCKHIKGFDERVSKDKSKLLNIVESRNKDKRSFQKNKEVYEKVYALHNEYATASYIHQNVPIELTDDVGKPDFKIIDSDILIETKMRLVNDKPAYKDPNDTNLTNKIIFSLLMKDGFGSLQSAFDEQNSDIG